MIKLNRTQVIFAVVAIVAVFGVYKLNGVLQIAANGGPELSADASASYNPADDPNGDPNHDGLTNAQDIAWGIDPLGPNTNSQGFLYGAEVAAGHDPITGIPLSDTNLTNQLSQLVTSGLYAGALNPASDSYNQSLADIANSVADSAQYAFTQTIDPSTLNSVGSTNQNDIAYLTQAGPMMQQFSQSVGEQFDNIENNLNTIGNKGFGDSSIQTFFSGQSSAYKNLSQTASTMMVPSNFLAEHAEFLSLIQEMQLISDSVVNGTTDPLKASVGLDKLGDVPQAYINILTDYKNQIQAAKLDPNVINGIFK